ncbi:hypothetical protein QYE76_044540 [Lolium multiflorum]|uniref:Reverse transcriptase Ty1/copia-type domain-containing protein n=1 Tax=Lolium multiflorum TaxID=4521 RepID=A0AAD8TL58_LOLMU|nr:hypothetical protein QYE76_044540 [Lolium multiflorum]
MVGRRLARSLADVRCRDGPGSAVLVLPIGWAAWSFGGVGQRGGCPRILAMAHLDYTTRFSLWQVKMRAILTQSSDLDEALDGFGKKDAKTWTDDEKRKDPALWLKLESICMSKDLTSKMHAKMKLFSHKLQEGASMMNHLSIFREIVSDLLSMEVNYDDEDLALILHDELTLAEVYEALQQREKMKSKVQAEGSSSKAEALQVEHDTEPATYTEAVAFVDRVKWISAMQEEMQSLDKNDTWDVVPLPKQKKVVCCIDYNDVFSPVVMHSSIRAFFGIVAMHDLELEKLDVKTAFLHGELEEEIYMDQPEGFVVPGKKDLVCKLKRSLYGLK